LVKAVDRRANNRPPALLDIWNQFVSKSGFAGSVHAVYGDSCRVVADDTYDGAAKPTK
jgi:hypothetical protein